jgi:hypothetical protein
MDRAVMFLIAGICVYYLLPPNERCLLGKYLHLAVANVFQDFSAQLEWKISAAEEKV